MEPDRWKTIGCEAVILFPNCEVDVNLAAMGMWCGNVNMVVIKILVK